MMDHQAAPAADFTEHESRPGTANNVMNLSGSGRFDQQVGEGEAPNTC